MALKKKYKTKQSPFRQFCLRVLGAFLISSLVLCLVLRWVPPPVSAFMMYRHLEDLIVDQRYQLINYQWVDREKISDNAFLAVIAAEDQRFFEHAGFDFHALESAVENYIEGGALRGGSTISQQVAKNLFLTPNKSFLRKGLEVWFTVLCETLLGKQRILTLYLNIAEFGDHLFGVEAASRYYFGISAESLSREQAALLAATLPNPLLLKALKPSRGVLKRQHWIMRQMRNVQLP